MPSKEFNFIDRYFKAIGKNHPSTILGIGDDAAISTIDKNCSLVSCIDSLIEGRHFLKNTTPYAIGYKSVAVNLSDLAAMGAAPFAILLALNLPQKYANDAFLAPFAQGISDICQKFKIDLIGGDTTCADTLSINITALGYVPKNAFIGRNGAKLDDIICVTGKLGSASFALAQLLKNKSCTLENALHYPTARVDLGQKLRGFAHAMIDISDGLIQDLGHILSQSGERAKCDFGADIFLDKLPFDNALDILPKHKKYAHILGGGDDYELCVCLSAQSLQQFNRLYPNALYPIGKICAQNSIRYLDNNERVDLNISGFNHF